VSVKGNADLFLTTPGVLGSFALTGTATAQSTLTGIFDVKTVSSLTGAWGTLNNLAIRASGAITNVSVLAINNSVFSAGDIGTMTTSQSILGSLILAGYDIGADHVFNTPDDSAFTNGTAKGNIGTINVGNSLGGSSIAANVKPVGQYANQYFGTGTGHDDLVVAGSLQGSITAIAVKGTIFGSTNVTEHYGIEAHTTIKSLKMAGAPLQLPWVTASTQGNITASQGVGGP